MTTPILRRFSFRATLLVNGGLNAGIIFACALLTPSTPVPAIVALLFASGMTRSMQFTALNTLAFADVPEGWMSGANTVFNMVQQLFMAMGIALGAVALRIAGLLGPGAAPGAIPLGHFRTAFILIGAISHEIRIRYLICYDNLHCVMLKQSSWLSREMMRCLDFPILSR